MGAGGLVGPLERLRLGQAMRFGEEEKLARGDRGGLDAKILVVRGGALDQPVVRSKQGPDFIQLGRQTAQFGWSSDDDLVLGPRERLLRGPPSDAVESLPAVCLERDQDRESQGPRRHAVDHHVIVAEGSDGLDRRTTDSTPPKNDSTKLPRGERDELEERGRNTPIGL